MRDRLTVRQVAEALGVSITRVHQFRMAGRLRVTDTVDAGGAAILYLFARSELERFVEAERAAGRERVIATG